MTDVNQILSEAFNLHQSGAPAQAEPLYRQILARQPNNAEVWHLLGVAAHQQGRQSEAIEAISRDQARFQAGQLPQSPGGRLRRV